MAARHATLVDCAECKGEGTVLGRYAGVAGCETPTIGCEACDGSGQVEVDDEPNHDTVAESDLEV